MIMPNHWDVHLKLILYVNCTENKKMIKRKK